MDKAGTGDTLESPRPFSSAVTTTHRCAPGTGRATARRVGFGTWLRLAWLGRCLLMAWALLVGSMEWAGWAHAATEPPAGTPAIFKQPPLAASVSLGPEVLTDAERAFIAGLPEVRVAIPLPAVQPFEVVGPDGAVSGIHPEMLGHLANAFRLKVRPVLYPSFGAALEAVRTRQADLMMTLGYSAPRSAFLAYTLGVTPLAGALFTRVGAPAAAAAAGDADLNGARFAVERDFVVNDFLRRQYPQAQVLMVETTGEALAAVADGRATHYLGGLLTTLDWLTRQPVPGIEINRLLNYSSGHYHFAVRKDWAPLASVLNKGFSTLRAQGVTPGAGGLDGAGRAAASLPAGMPLPQPLRLAAPELQLLVQQPVWRVGAVRGLPLLNHLEPDGLHTGIAAEATEQVVRRLGVGLQVVGFDTVGAMLDGLRRGEIDLVPFLTRTPSRETEFAFSRPYAEMPYVIVARSDAPLYWSLDSLRGRRLALAAQHPLRPLLASRYPDIRTVDVADGREALDAVADGRADAAVEVKLFANLRINGDNDDRLRTVSVVDEVPAQFHFATLRQAPPLLGLVDRALADIPPADLLRMQRRWVAVDLAPAFPWRRWAPLIATLAAALLVGAAGTAWWLRRLQREVGARRRSEQRLRDIAAAMPGVAFRHVFSADGQHMVAGWVSSRAADLLGLPAPPRKDRQTLLARLAQHLPPAERDALVMDEQRCLASGERLRRTVPYDHPDGQRRWLTCEAVRTEAERGLQAWTGYVIDTSHEHELQAQLVEAAQSRNLVLASASHELRAPAHTLALALQALPGGGLGPAHDTALRVARDAVDTLSQLLGDVLDAARLDGAPPRLQPRDVDLRELLQRVGEGAATTAQSKGLTFTRHIDPALPERVHLDPLRLRQVLVNLLSNAIKYTATGQVDLRVEHQAPGGPADDAGPAWLVLCVTDTGPGLAPELQGRLFTPYASADLHAPGQPGQGSSGLGLAITRQLCERMGGALHLDGPPGQGTRATVRLPLAAAAPTTTVPARPGVVLLCDDDDTSRLLLLHLLRAQGFGVEEATSAEAALARCSQGGVAAVITDLQMPGLGGLGLLRALRPPVGAPSPGPALLVCSGDSAGQPGSVDTTGLADVRLAKPVDLPTLVAQLAGLGVTPT